MGIYTEVITLKITKTQKENLNKLKLKKNLRFNCTLKNKGLTL